MSQFGDRWATFTPEFREWSIVNHKEYLENVAQREAEWAKNDEGLDGMMYPMSTSGGGGWPAGYFPPDRCAALPVLTQWDATYWGWVFPYGTSPAEMWPDYDLSDDGVPNLVNYLIGTDPTDNSRDCAPQGVIKEYRGEDYLAVTFLQPTWMGGVRYILESSKDLIQWSEHCGTVILVDDELGPEYPGHYRQVWVLDEQPITENEDNKRFLRLQLLHYGGDPEGFGGPPIADPTLATRLTNRVLADDPNLSVTDVRFNGFIGAADCFSRGIDHGLVGYDENDEIEWSMDEGIVLTTGWAADWNRTGVLANRNIDQPGDSQLETWMQNNPAPDLLGSHDATVLEIDFVPEHNRLGMTFLFASEEYYEANPPKNDAMAIFLGRYENGVVDWQPIGGPNEEGNIDGNIALLPVVANPDTNSRTVSVFNIGEVTNHDPPLTNYVDWFVNNSADSDDHTPPNPDAPPFDVTYSGFTRAFDVVAEVVPYETHIVRIVVADGDTPQNDPKFDAAVFLESGSFISFQEN